MNAEQNLLLDQAAFATWLSRTVFDREKHEVAVVCGKASFEKSGAKALLEKRLAGLKTTYISEFSTNPNTVDLDRLRRVVCGHDFSLYIAVGGGSVIDMAKLLRLFARLSPDTEVVSYLSNPVLPEKQLSPLLAIPTTAGSGSEATPFAVLYHGKCKHSIEFPALRPESVALLPDLLASLPARIRACSALDAFSQAIESYWNVNSTEYSKATAMEAIHKIKRVMIAHAKGDVASDRIMQEGAYLAGKAIAVTRTTAPHAISYPMTSFFRIPHGAAVALTLGSFLEYNYYVTQEDCNDPRGAEYVTQTMCELYDLLGVSTPAAAKEWWYNHLAAIGISPRLADHGIKSTHDVETIVQNGFNPGRVKNNPRKLDAVQLREMLQR